MRFGISKRVFAGLLAVAPYLGAQAHPSPAAPPKSNAVALPEGEGKDALQRVCSSCHSANIVLGRGLSKDEWGDVVNSMVGRGAKVSDADFPVIVDYLAKSLPPKGAGGTVGAAPKKRGGGGLTVGADDKHVVDDALALKGKQIYAAECITCHGPKARGADQGPDLVRSVTVMHDRYGSALGPFFKGKHPTQSGRPTSSFSSADIEALSHFLHEQLNDTLRSGPYSKVLNVLTGDATAGARYFQGPGGCQQCHSTTGDLAGVASRYDAPTLQQRLLFPRTMSAGRGSRKPPKATMATVTTGGETVEGTLSKIDDFNVSLHDSSGVYHSWKRTPEVKVEIKDPYAAHNALLDQYTDKDMHDVVAYLETLK